MHKNTALKMYLFLVAVIIGLGLIGTISTYYLQKNNIEKYANTNVIIYNQRFDTYIDEEAHIMESYLKLIEDKKELRSAFIKSDKTELFKKTESILKHLKSNNEITHFYFIKPDGKILLRVHDENKSNDIVNRYTFLKAKQTNKSFYGVEFGIKKNYTLRLVLPWIVDGKTIGYLELGKEIDKISETLSKQKGIEIFYAIQKSQFQNSEKSVQEKLKSYMQTRDYYVVYQTLPSNNKIIDFIETHNSDTKWLEIDNQYYICYVEDFEDVSKITLGEKVFLVNVTKEYGDLLKSVTNYSIIMLLVTSLLLLVVFILLRNKQKMLNDAFLKIEAKTLEQKSLLSLFDKGDFVLFRWNNDERWSIDYVSSNVESLFGYTKDEFLNSEIIYANCIYKEDLERVFGEVRYGQQNNSDFFKHEPYRIVAKDGTVKWVLDHTVLNKDSNGNITHFLGYIIDITDEENNKKILQAQKEEFETVFKFSKDGIAILHLELNFLDFNEAYREMVGFAKEELLQKSCTELTAPEFKERSTEALKSVIEIGHIENVEKVCIVKDNRRIIVNMSVSLLPDKQRFLLLTKDVTNLKALEEQSKLASMGEMIGNIAHQWRQPLSVISTNATGMIMQHEYGLLNDELLLASCNQINENAQYLSKTIDDFRNFIQGDTNLNFVHVSKIINEALNILKGNLSNHYINLVLSIEDDIEINTNKNELEQAIINIVNNAKDAVAENVTEEDRVIFISTKKLDDVSLELKICDNGGGIPLDVIDKIFEPYFTTKHKSRGTGLGLSMVNQIIRERYHQKLNVYNEKIEYNGKEFMGTCFVIIFSSTN